MVVYLFDEEHGGRMTERGVEDVESAIGKGRRREEAKKGSFSARLPRNLIGYKCHVITQYLPAFEDRNYGI